MTDATPSIVRPATLADRAEILALHHLSLRVLSRELYSEQEIESYLRYTPTLEGYLIEDSTYYVARIGERLAGCGGWSMKAPAYTHVTGDSARRSRYPIPKVRAMFVHPHFARRGIGRQLLGIIERAIVAAGYAEANLDATLSGVPLYARCGYAAFGETHAVLPDGVRMRFVCMRKRLVEVCRPCVEHAR